MRWWHGDQYGVRYKQFAHSTADKTATTITSCLGVTFLVPVYPGCPGKGIAVHYSESPLALTLLTLSITLLMIAVLTLQLALLTLTLNLTLTIKIVKLQNSGRSVLEKGTLNQN